MVELPWRVMACSPMPVVEPSRLFTSHITLSIVNEEEEEEEEEEDDDDIGVDGLVLSSVLVSEER